MRLVVTSNCQTGGIAAALARMTRSNTVRAEPIKPGEDFEGFRARLLPLISGAQVWIVVSGPTAENARRLRDDARLPGLRLLTIPAIAFDAFHPDMTYAMRVDRDGLLEPHYNSAIGLWLFNRRIAPSFGRRLYCERTYRHLGYLDRWTSAVESLRQAFLASDLAPYFVEFFLAVKRLGCFMYSLNHPRIEVLRKLAELIARELGVRVVSPLQPGELDDALNFEIWPVYPEIADVLGVPDSGYHWRSNLGKVRDDSVEQYLARIFRVYLRLGLRPGDLRPHGFPLPDLDARIASIATEVFRDA